MGRFNILSALALVAALASNLVPASGAPADGRYAGAPVRVDGLTLPARVQGRDVALATGNGFSPRYWPGVNLGSTIPGYQPGEVAATREMYARWLEGMQRLGVRVVRIYTILRPGFYEALAAHNRRYRDAPIRLIHGVWIPEDEFVAGQNLYAPAVTEGFRAEIDDAVAVVHGSADLPHRLGHASGRYRADISQWVLGWSIGVEWDPIATEASDRLNAGAPAFAGRFFTSAPGSTPTESWIASMLEHLATREAERGWSRPVTFTNWLTVDPLRHPDEPLPKEDIVSVDAAHVAATPAWPGGFFASYHVYPYYPDFLRFQSDLLAALGPDGQPDPYLGILRALRAHHRDQALMVTELGVPSSIGSAHNGPRGRNQGGHSEQEAARINAEMMGLLKKEGYAGGLLFEWVDEWFKFTWNTIDYELPGDRRQLWRNPLTNEENFGIIAADAVSPAVLDGRDVEWKDGQSRAVHSTHRGAVREVRAAHDPAYLHLLVRFDRPNAWQRGPVRIGFDARAGGNGGLPGLPGLVPEAEVAVEVGPGNRARILQAAWTDPIAFQYGVNRGYVPANPADLAFQSGAWVSPRLILNRPYALPSTGAAYPVELMDVGTLRWGTGDPQRRGFDQRNLVMGSGDILELRIPWALLTFADPSSHRVVVPGSTGEIDTQLSPGVRVSVVVGRNVSRGARYNWRSWNRVTWTERPKAGWETLRRSYHALAGVAVPRPAPAAMPGAGVAARTKTPARPGRAAGSPPGG